MDSVQINITLDKETLREALGIPAKDAVVMPPQQLPEKVLLSQNDVKEWLGVGQDYLDRFIDEGLPRVQIAGRILYVPGQVVDWLATKQI